MFVGLEGDTVMTKRRYVLFGIAALAVHFSVTGAAGVDYNSFKTDAEVDQWLRRTSATYATIVKRIKSSKDVHGYRFATKDNIRRGMLAWVEGHLEIQLNAELSGPDRVTTLIFEMANARSEERRVGKECRSRWSPYH
jgi:hypothetical protein